MKKCHWILYLSLICIICISCKQKIVNADMGFPSLIQTFTMPDSISVINDIYTFADTSYIIPRHEKLIVGHINGIQARSLLRFDTTLDDTLTTIHSLIVTLNINKINQNITFLYNVSIISDFAFAETNTIADDFPNWLKANDTEKWIIPGGDISNAMPTFTHNTDPEKNTLSFNISNPYQNKSLDLLIFAENSQENYIEIHSRHILDIRKRPSISIKYINANEDTISITRYAIADAFIYSPFSITTIERENISISNIPQKSLYIGLNDFETLFKIYHLVSDDQDLRWINIVKAEIVFTIKGDENTYTTGDNINLTAGIPEHEHTDDITYKALDLKYRSPTNASIKENENHITIDVTNQIKHIFAKNTENFGIVLLNNRINEDFSYIYFDRLTDENKPKLTLKYSIYTQTP